MKKYLYAFVFLLTGCMHSVEENSPYKHYTYVTPLAEKKQYLIWDIELFRGSKAWGLAKAVYEQDTGRIGFFCRKDTSLANATEKNFGLSILEWAVVNNRYNSCEALLRYHANPNIEAGEATPFELAAGNRNTTIYVELLLKYGGQINTDTTDTLNRLTVLEAAAASNVENLKLLMGSGADTNAGINNHLLYRACLNNNIKVIKYLIVDCGVDYKKPLYLDDTTNGQINLYIDFELKHMGFEKGTREDSAMQQVLDYIQKHGAVKTVLRPDAPDYGK